MKTPMQPRSKRRNRLAQAVRDPSGAFTTRRHSTVSDYRRKPKHPKRFSDGQSQS